MILMKKSTHVIMILFAVLIIAILLAREPLEELMMGSGNYWECREGEWVPVGNPSGDHPDTICHEGGTLFFNDGESGLEIAYPMSWENKIDIEHITEDDRRIIKFSYLSGDEHNPMIFMINIYPSSHSVWQIDSEPNNKIVMVSDKNIFSLTQSLDMPFMKGDLDYDDYVAINNQKFDVIDAISVRDLPFTRAKNILEKNQENNYYINAIYPEFINMPFADKINSAVLSTVEELQSSFESQVADWSILGDIEPIAPSGLNINFELESITADIVSFRLLISDYFSSAAHPNNRSLSFNYNLGNGEAVKLEDIISVEDYLTWAYDRVSPAILDAYRERGLGDWPATWSNEFKSSEEYFDNFTLKGDKIIFHYDPYEIGPYSAGGFDIEIEL